MRLSELIPAFLLFCSSCTIFSGFVSPFFKAVRNYEESKRLYSRNLFIAESFTALCSSKDTEMEDFENWKKMCRGLYDLESIEITKHMDEQKLKCIWKKDGRAVSLTCRRKL